MRQPGLELQELNHESPPLSPHSAPQAWALARRFPGQGPAEERAAACHRYPRAFTTRPPWPAEAMLARGALHLPAAATSPGATAKRGACSAAGGRRAAATDPASDGGLFDGRGGLRGFLCSGAVVAVVTRDSCHEPSFCLRVGRPRKSCNEAVLGRSSGC